ncbi:glycerophosphodiester phosphodiesterase family protein [Vibrio sp. nBUS_14]|uniref:glycerophosphodiester phosphodiesterase family protein n=1 Tax=Vibrio sp. nBUS_14 TaxID=3395321 RepID=UPI003EB74DE7
MWAHRGLTTVERENSISAFSSAFKHGAAGVELDVYFHNESFQFIVSHEPIIDVVNSEVLTLRDVIDAIHWLEPCRSSPGCDATHPDREREEQL